jgi:hypothetical protein
VAGDVCGFVGGEKSYGAGDVLGIAYPAERDLFYGGLLEFLA